jgi:hypothetical protein
MHANAVVAGGRRPAVTSGEPVQNRRRAPALKMMMYEDDPMWWR